VRILQLCSRYPPAPGGAERHVEELCRELSRRGHEVAVLTSDMYCDTPLVRMRGVDPSNGVRVRRSFSLTVPGEADFPIYPGMLPAALAEKADVLHVHGYGCFQTMVAPLVRKLRRVKTVFTTHFHPDWSDWGGYRRAGLRRLYDRLLGPYSTGGADALIVHTEAERALLRRFGLLPAKTPVHVIPSGIRLEHFAAPPAGDGFRERLGIGPDERIVLFAGRLAPKKGLDTLLDAAPAVVARFPRARFLVAGEDMGLGGWLRSEIRKRGLSARFSAPGLLPERDLLAAYHICDVLALPSEYEAFGLVLAEAMACAKPCVATRVGGVPEVVEDGETGLLVPPRDPAALAGALGRVLGDPEEAGRMGRAGRIRAGERFALGPVVDRIEAAYSP
jgi:starch synthase